MMNKEIFKSIDGYEGIYQVSNKGRIYSIVNDIFLNGSIGSNGYLVVSLYRDGFSKTVSIHTRVAVNFVKGRKRGYVVNHIDEVKSNNNASNLEWTTVSGNLMHKGARDRMIISRHNGNKQLRGATFDKDANKWRSLIGCNGKYIHLGRFLKKSDAYIAYRNKFIELHGFEPWNNKTLKEFIKNE